MICRLSKDDITFALNHIDNGHRTTDIYIAKGWKIINELQLKVVCILRNLDEPSTAAQLLKCRLCL